MALSHAKLHAEAAKGCDKVEYFNANRKVLVRCANYPEAKAVLEEAGLVQ